MKDGDDGNGDESGVGEGNGDDGDIGMDVPVVSSHSLGVSSSIPPQYHANNNFDEIMEEDDSATLDDSMYSNQDAETNRNQTFHSAAEIGQMIIEMAYIHSLARLFARSH